MKNLMKLAGILFMALLIVSCSKDDDPVDDDIFVGSYKGSIAYKKDGENQSYDEGKVTVVKLSKKHYNFHFNHGIPDLTGVEFEEEGDHTLINVDFEDGIQYIRIDESTLKMHYSKDDETWEANADR